MIVGYTIYCSTTKEFVGNDLSSGGYPYFLEWLDGRGMIWSTKEEAEKYADACKHASYLKGRYFVVLPLTINLP